MLRQLALYANTVRHLRLRQMAFYALRRWLPPRRAILTAMPIIRSPVTFSAPCPTSAIYVNDSTFRFLNREVNLGNVNTTIDWQALKEKRLWQYNLHYFDYLREPSRPDNNKDLLIQSWIDENPQGMKPGWEPFTTSLRIVNWIFHFSQKSANDIPPAWLESLYLQAKWLERNVEKHILANHYFENLKALVFAGCYFRSNDAMRWLKRGVKEVPEQIEEQTLNDGGHYEHSHMYHCLMLENYLDIINLSSAYPLLFSDEFTQILRRSAELSIDWLNAMLCPDGKIPLFNDSVFGVAPSPQNLLAYAERLSLNVNRNAANDVILIDRRDSGYYGCRVARDMLIVDCGDIGPAYQPGHTHCDFLSFELMLQGQRIVIDTGVYEYEPGSLRHYVRSTAAHNTVSVDGREQSEIWGQFRVARRARKIQASIGRTGNSVMFHGGYAGFFNVRNGIEHHRRMTVELDECKPQFGRLLVEDHIIGRGHHSVDSYVHLHPDVTPVASLDGHIDLMLGTVLVASIGKSRNLECEIETGLYCPEFGLRLPNSVLVFRVAGVLPLSLSYEFQVIAH